MQKPYSSVLKFFFVIIVNLLVISWQPEMVFSAPVLPNSNELAQAVQEIESLDTMRTTLAASLEGSTETPSLKTMKEVCRPVGMRAMQLSKENGWEVKQVAVKYRNPDHAPSNLHDQIALAKFTQETDLIGFWDRETLHNQTGTRYYRRIDVEASCLACHGVKDRRPQFVQNSYPQDLAYNFQVGDLRGMYAVFIPDNVQKTIQNAVN